MGVMDAHGNQFEGTNFRFRRDDGTQDPFTDGWMAALNTNISLPLSATQFRWRAGVRKVGGTQETALQVGYQKNGTGGYALVADDGTTPVTNVSTTYATNNEDIIPYTGANQVYTDTFADTTNGCMITDDAQSNTGLCNFDATSGFVGMSVEMCMKLEPSLLAIGDYLELRLYLDGLVPFSSGWLQTARIDIIAGYHQFLPEHIRRMALGAYRAN